MVPSTDGHRHRGLPVGQFYDALASSYDAMTGFEKRFVQERPFFRVLVERYNIKTALDAGSGTGFHSLLLAKLGVRVTAVDLSRNMLDVLKDHARQMDVAVETMDAPFGELPARLHRRFDAVFCMGNALAHTESDADLRRILSGFGTLVEPRGILFLQVLNYDRILATREKVQSVKETGETIFVRFYEYGGEAIQFHILKLRRTPDGISHELQTTRLHPVLRRELEASIQQAGFGDPGVFGGISLEPFKSDLSKDLVVLAQKS